MNTFGNSTPTRAAATTGLAVVGFVALVALGMWLAIYSTRFVPAAVNRAGEAAVYLGSLFNAAPSPTLSVIPTASTTISFGEASSTLSTSATTTVPKPTTATKPKSASTTAGTQTSGTYPISGTSTPATLSGLPDLIVTIRDVGYLATSSASSFVATSTVPAGFRPAVTFTIKNIGTNATGVWRFSASIPTQTAYIYASQPQQSLNPGDSIDYTLGFDQASAGTDRTISITANSDYIVAESNSNNNSASTKITILGS